MIYTTFETLNTRLRKLYETCKIKIKPLPLRRIWHYVFNSKTPSSPSVDTYFCLSNVVIKPDKACNIFLSFLFLDLILYFHILNFQISPPGHHIFVLLLLLCFHHLLLLPPVLLLPTQSGQILPVAHLVVRIELFTIRLTVRADLRAILPQEKAWTPHGNFPLP